MGEEKIIPNFKFEPEFLFKIFLRLAKHIEDQKLNKCLVFEASAHKGNLSGEGGGPQWACITEGLFLKCNA